MKKLREIIREELLKETAKQARLLAKELKSSVDKLNTAVAKGNGETASRLIAIIDRDFKKFRSVFIKL